MNNRILLVAESGSDMTNELVAKYGVTIVPMHVAFGGETRDDGSFPVEEMFAHYAKTRELPRTSGCTPHDFEMVFSNLEQEYPDAKILHLAYSASTTCSMQSAIIAAEDHDNIISIDTKSVSAGQTAVVVSVADYIRTNPQASIEDVMAKSHDLIAKVRMGFIPGDLEYLRAGGRVSNAAYLGAKLLSLHPLIEILDGKLLSTKKYRGAKNKVVAKMTQEYLQQLDPQEPLYLIYGEGLDSQIKQDVEQIVTETGFPSYTWIRTGCVIAAHSGPGAFGVVGFAR